MKIENLADGRVGSVITYDDNELNFIATLDEKLQRNIFRGIAIPSDYGYNSKSVYFKIDGQSIEGTPTICEQFVEFFNELETLLMSDDKKYWVLYEEVNPETPFHKEYFWCIPASEIDFIWDEENGWCIVSDEDDEECELEEDEYCYKLNTFTVFERNFGEYLLYNPKADANDFKVYKSIQKWANTPTDPDVCADNTVCLITYLEKYWNAWLQSILDREYKYMNLTQMVWNSWEER